MTQMTEKRAKDNTQDWESHALGSDMDSAEAVSAEIDKAVDASLNLKPISIRLQAELIGKLKIIAAHHGIGYQPLIRSYLHRCVRDEIREIAEYENPAGES
jgi:predicted DNA binding CopG/RHH family protein